MARSKFDFDLIVIGSGAGGSAAATIAARENKKVAIVEADTFGGTSPNWGDVPIKSLLHAAHLLDEARHGARFGLRTSTISYNYPTLRAWKDLAVKRTGAGGNRKYYENEGITTIHGTAHFLSPHEISVNRSNYSAASFLIATGSVPVIPDIQGLEDSDYDTPRTILEAIRPPKSLYIIGGGATAIELAQLMAIFGTKVYIAEIAARVLPGYDSEAGELLEKLLADKNITVLTQTRTLAVDKENIAYRITYSRGGTEHSLRVDNVLIAAGRTPNVDLGLENAGVNYDANGVKANEYLQTSEKHIYAAGDVLGRHKYTHTALLESRIAVSNLLSKKNKLIPDYTATPKVVFSYPSIASVGLTEDDCLRRDLNIKKAFAPLNIVARSNTSDFRDGFVKLITDKKGVVIGATIMAPGAGELIHEIGLAIKYGLTAEELASTPHAFLTWSEAVRVAAAKLA
jgi:mercuric reductase